MTYLEDREWDPKERLGLLAKKRTHGIVLARLEILIIHVSTWINLKQIVEIFDVVSFYLGCGGCRGKGGGGFGFGLLLLLLHFACYCIFEIWKILGLGYVNGFGGWDLNSLLSILALFSLLQQLGFVVFFAVQTGGREGSMKRTFGRREERERRGELDHYENNDIHGENQEICF